MRNIKKSLFRTTAQPNNQRVLSDNLLAIFDSFLDTRETGVSQVAVTWPVRFESITMLPAFAQLEYLLSNPENTQDATIPLNTLMWPWARSGQSLQNRVLCDREQIACANMLHYNHLYSQGVNTGGLYKLHLGLASIKDLAPDSNYAQNKNKQVKQELRHPSLSELTPTLLVRSGTKQGHVVIDDKISERFLKRVKKHTYMSRKNADVTKINIEFCIDEYPSLAMGATINVDTAALAKSQELKALRPDVILLEGYLLDSRLGNRWVQRVYDFIKSIKSLYSNHELGMPPLFIVTDNLYAAKIFHDRVLPFYESRNPDDYRNYVPLLNYSKDIFVQPKPIQGAKHIINFDFTLFAAEHTSLILDGERLAAESSKNGDHDLASSIRQLIQSWRWFMTMPYGIDAYIDFLESEDAVEKNISHKTGVQPFYHVFAVRRILGEAGLFSDKQPILDYIVKVQKIMGTLKIETPLYRLIYLALYSDRRNSERQCLIVFPNNEMAEFTNWLVLNHPDWSKLLKRLKQTSFHFFGASQFTEMVTNDQVSTQRVYWVSPKISDLVSLLSFNTSVKEIIIATEIGKLGEMHRCFTRVCDIYKGCDDSLPFEKFHQAIESYTAKAKITEMPRLPDIKDKYYPKTYVNQYRSDGGSFSIRILLSRNKKELLCSKGTQVLKFNSENELQPFSVEKVEKIQVGNEICVIDDDFFDEIRTNFSLVANASTMLRAYHKAIILKFKIFPGSSLDEKSAYLRSKVLKHAGSDVHVPSIGAVRRWVEVEHLADKVASEVNSHAPKNWKLFLAFMLALDFSEDIAQVFWNQGIQRTRGERITVGNASHSFFLNAIVCPDSVIGKFPEYKENIEHLLEEAHRSVSTIKLIEEIA